MYQLQISLLGRLLIRAADEKPIEIEALKARELLCFLLIHHDSPHRREAICNILWPDCPAPKSKQYLRQALWGVHHALDHAFAERERVITVDGDWLQACVDDRIWIDIYEFEEAFLSVRGIRGWELNQGKANSIKKAVLAYRGELLAGWHYDWCIFERERLYHEYLSLLEKLVVFCEYMLAYEEGIHFANLILRSDIAHERTYRRLIRLYYLAGDRSSALRQFEICKVALRRELDVEPSKQTLELHQMIRSGIYHEELFKHAFPTTSPAAYANKTRSLIQQLTQLKRMLLATQLRLEDEIRRIKSTLLE